MRRRIPAASAVSAHRACRRPTVSAGPATRWSTSSQALRSRTSLPTASRAESRSPCSVPLQAIAW